METMKKARVWIPPWLEKELKNLTNHRGMHTFKGREGDLITVAAILGLPKLKDMTAEDIINLLEEAAQK